MGMPAGQRLIFVTHSKGTVDALEAIVKYPGVAERICAVVSVAGAVNGSPLADVFPQFLSNLLHRLPLASCASGEGAEAIESLRRNVRHFVVVHAPAARERTLLFAGCVYLA